MNDLTDQMETDQSNLIDQTSDLSSLAKQVKKLQSLENKILQDEESLKQKKKDLRWNL